MQVDYLPAEPPKAWWLQSYWSLESLSRVIPRLCWEELLPGPFTQLSPGLSWATKRRALAPHWFGLEFALSSLSCGPVPRGSLLRQSLKPNITQPLKKKEQNNAVCTNMVEARDCHTEWNKSDRERQISYDITYVQSKKNSTNKLICKTEIGSQM